MLFEEAQNVQCFRGASGNKGRALSRTDSDSETFERSLLISLSDMDCFVQSAQRAFFFEPRKRMDQVAVVSMGKTIIIKKKIMPIIIMIGAFILAYTVGINIVLVILASAAVGIITTLLSDRKKGANS
jgi:hypothetical protein